jgi:hypothetical protein
MSPCASVAFPLGSRNQMLPPLSLDGGYPYLGKPWREKLKVIDAVYLLRTSTRPCPRISRWEPLRETARRSVCLRRGRAEGVKRRLRPLQFATRSVRVPIHLVVRTRERAAVAHGGVNARIQRIIEHADVLAPRRISTTWVTLQVSCSRLVHGGAAGRMI